MSDKKSVPMNGNSLAHVTSLSVDSKTKSLLFYTEKQTFVPYHLSSKKRGMYGL